MLGKLILAGLAATSVQGAPTINVSSAFPAVTGAPSAAASSGQPGSATGAAAVPNPSISPELLERLDDAPTAVARFKVIQADDPTKLKFDFNVAANPGVVPGMGGQVNLAKVDNFPALKDLGISSAVGFMNPCGLNTPHTHPRATEFLTLVQGDNLKTGFILENGLISQFSTTLTKFQGTVFPMGSIHFQFNDNCEPAVFVAGLNSEDPGTSQIAQNFFTIDPEIVDAALGFPKDIDATNIGAFAKTIPSNMALGIQQCLKRCNIAY